MDRARLLGAGGLASLPPGLDTVVATLHTRTGLIYTPVAIGETQTTAAANNVSSADIGQLPRASSRTFAHTLFSIESSKMSTSHVQMIHIWLIFVRVYALPAPQTTELFHGPTAYWLLHTVVPYWYVILSVQEFI
jgi:hypothetical protein